MSSLTSKRTRKRKVFEGFHTGDEIIDAFKSKSKAKVVAKKRISQEDQKVRGSNLEKENVGEVRMKKENVGEVRATANSPVKISTAIFKKSSKVCSKFNRVSRNEEKCTEEAGSKKKCIEIKDTKDDDCREEVKQYSSSCNKPKDSNNNKFHDHHDDDEEEDKVDEQNSQYCAICNDIHDGDLVTCNGTCLNQFHSNCLGLNFMPTNFTCDECTLGVHTCFVCSKVGELTKCSQATCGKYYHIECLQNNSCIKFEDKSKTKFTCPLHVCRYCNDKKFVKTVGKRFLKCVKCPVAYHYCPCIPAGCSILTPTQMICDEHFEPNKNNGVPHVNTTWCFVCSKGGSLVCCDKCPASFHVECSDDLTSVPTGAWQCQDCREGNKLRYGDIVWVKYSIYRWWPAKICLPEEVPEKVKNLSHSVGEFPVQFFGSQDYCWLNSGQVCRYADEDTGGKHPITSYLAKYFQKAQEEAHEAFTTNKMLIEEVNPVHETKQTNKPPSYGHIKTNRPVSCVRTVLDRNEWPICHCKADDPCKSECLNKMLYYECHPSLCPNGDNCKNQRILKSKHAKAKIFKSKGRGWGLRAEQEIKTGDFVIEYVGELIDEETCRNRIKQYHKNDINDYYFLTIDKDNIIDAYPKGNLSRFMNHSCEPNCETQKWTVSGEVRVGLFATRDIVAGEELSFNYNLDCLGNEKKQCKCASVNCSGYLGVQPKTQHSINVAEKLKGKTNEKSKTKKKKKRKLVHDCVCFICRDGGDLLLCSRMNCTKAYHHDCLIMDTPPKGRWDCPWHFCDECGKLARSMCSLCPNSFCESHLDGQMIELKEDVLVCPAHDEEEMENLKKENVDRSPENIIDEDVGSQIL